MRKAKGNVVNQAKNNGKFKNIKRYIAASAAVVLAASVVMSSIVSRTEAAENVDTLMGIEKLRSNFSSKDNCFTVLEIVPNESGRDAADIGYLFDGYEPALSSWDSEKKEWVSWKDDLFTKATEAEREALIYEKAVKLHDYYEKMGLSGENVPVILPENYEMKEGFYHEWNGEGSQSDYVEVRSDDYERTGYFALAGNSSSLRSENLNDSGAYGGTYNLIFEKQGSTKDYTAYYVVKSTMPLSEIPSVNYDKIADDMPVYVSDGPDYFKYKDIWGNIKPLYEAANGLNADEPVKVKSKDSSGQEAVSKEDEIGAGEEEGSQDSNDDLDGETDTGEEILTDDEDSGSSDNTRTDSDSQENTTSDSSTSKSSVWKKLVNGMDDNSDDETKEDSDSDDETGDDDGAGGDNGNDEESGEGNSNDEDNGNGEGIGDDDGDGTEGEDPEEGDTPKDDEDNDDYKEKGKTEDKNDPNRATSLDEEYYIVDFEYTATPRGAYYVVQDEGVILSTTRAGQYDFVDINELENPPAAMDVQSYKFPDKMLYCKGVFRSNEWFKKYVLNMREENFDNFHAKVITLTPDDLNTLNEKGEIPKFHFLYLNSGTRKVIEISTFVNSHGNRVPVPGGEEGKEETDEDTPDEEDGDDETGDEGEPGNEDGTEESDGSEEPGEDDGNEENPGEETGSEDETGEEGSNENQTGEESANSGETGETGSDTKDGNEGNNENSGTNESTQKNTGRSKNTSGWMAYVSQDENENDLSDPSNAIEGNEQQETSEDSQDNTNADTADTTQDEQPGNSKEEEQTSDPEDEAPVEDAQQPEDSNDSEDAEENEDFGSLETAAPSRAPYNTATSDVQPDVMKYLYEQVAAKALPCLVDGNILFKEKDNGTIDFVKEGTDTDLFRLALLMCQESLETDNLSASSDDLRKNIVEDADKNFATDQVYCRFGNGSDSIINSLFFTPTFYREGGVVEPGFQKVWDEIVLENLYRASDTSGSFKPLSTNMGQAETVRHILNYQNSRNVTAKKDIKVLEIQPARTTTPQLTKEQIQKWAPGVETVETKIMTTAEFIGKIDKINEIYDLVYIGSSKEYLNISNWITDSGKNSDGEYVGSTVFNDSDMDGLIYYNVGDKRVVDLPMAGLLDSEYPSGNGTGRPYYYNFVRYSGNDITKEKKDALLAFLDGSYPIVLSDDFMEKPVTLFEANDYAGRRGSLEVGDYTQEDLKKLQIYAVNDGTKYNGNYKGISSIKVKKGYKVTLYASTDLSVDPEKPNGNEVLTLTENMTKLMDIQGSNWNDKCQSIRVEKIDETTSIAKTIDEDTLDNSSYMYEFVSTALRKSYTNFFVEGDIDKTGSELFKFYLNRPKASLVNFTANGLKEGVLDSGVQINDVNYIYPNSAGKYTLQYSFSIKNEGAASMETRYNCKLYIDVNADGKFSDSEEVTDIVLLNRNSGGIVSSEELYAGINYTLTREVPTGYKGLLPWKVEICQVNNDNIYASEQGYTKLQGLEKETIKICQIHRNVAQAIKLDEEVNIPGERHYFNILVKGGTGPDGIVYKGIEDDFELDVTTMSTVEFQRRYYENNAYLDDFNMLILGFSDMYDDFEGDDKTGPMSAIVDFINSGKSVLLAHDTTSFFNVPMINGQQLGYPWRNNLNDARGFNNDTRNAATLNIYIRPLVGMDRYAVLKNATVKKGLVLHEGDAEWNNLFSTGTEIAYKPKSGRTETVPEAQGYTYGLISAKDRKSAGGDEGIPRQQYTKWNLYSSGYNNLDNIVFENKYVSQRFERSWFWDSEYDEYGEMTLDSKNNGEVDEVNVTQVNQGQITEYPYKLKEKFEVAITHNQYYQLDYTADDDGDGQSDLVVWYCLGDRNPPDGNKDKRETIYSQSPNDVRNNYYIYNKGNITYTGMGHARKDDWREPYTFEEAKLFINTMIAAYQAGMKPPTINALESGRPDAATIKTLYRYFDEINLIPLSDAVEENYEKIYFTVRDLNFVKGTRTIESHVFYQTNAGSEVITVGTEEIRVNRLDDRIYNAADETPVDADKLESGGIYYIEVPKSILDDCETGLDLYFEAQSTIIPYINNQANMTQEELAEMIRKRTKQTDKVYTKLKVLRSYLFELD